MYAVCISSDERGCDFGGRLSAATKSEARNGTAVFCTIFQSAEQNITKSHPFLLDGHVARLGELSPPLP